MKEALSIILVAYIMDVPITLVAYIIDVHNE